MHEHFSRSPFPVFVSPAPPSPYVTPPSHSASLPFPSGDHPSPSESRPVPSAIVRAPALVHISDFEALSALHPFHETAAVTLSAVVCFGPPPAGHALKPLSAPVLAPVFVPPQTTYYLR